MKEKKVLNQLIALLPMPAVVIDNKGIIEEANIAFTEKFNFNRISKKNKIKLQTFLNLDITNFLHRLSLNDMTISTYDYKFVDLNENEVLVEKIYPISVEINKLLMDIKYIDEILISGASKAEKIASKKVTDIKKKIGF